MDAPTITVQLPADLYAKLQSLATQERTDLVEMLDRLITAEPQPFARVIVKDPQLRGGRPIIAGTGVTVRTVVGHYKLGLTPEEIADQLDLDLAPVYAALAYYHLNRDEVEADILANSEPLIRSFFTSGGRFQGPDSSAV